LQAYQTQLTKKGQEMVAALQDKAKVLEQKNAEGGIAPKDYEAQMLKLQEEEKEIAKYEQEVYQKLGEKRETLYKPVLDKLNEAMKLVAQEQGMNMVFDTGSQVLLYADESLDVTPLVKVKMGIK
jgi:outer membrane protein